MRIDGLKNRLSAIESKTTAGLTPTTDASGRRCWLKHSGISALREIIHAERQAKEAGHELTRADLPPELLEELDLWSRAELPPHAGALAVMVRSEARRILPAYEDERNEG